MKDMHLRVEQAISEECSALLTSFLCGVDGIQAVRVDQADVWIRFDDSTVPDERVLAMARSSVELLGYHLSFA